MNTTATSVTATLDKPNNNPQAIADDFKHYLENHLGRNNHCDPVYLYEALSYAIRDRLMPGWCDTTQTTRLQPDTRRAYYMSLEFLIGRSLSNNLLNLGITDNVDKALYELGNDLEQVIDQEADAGLGNGGLGRLAACFMDSCATLGLPVLGYGIRYEYGMFRQHLENGYQIEAPDHWLRDGNPWEIERAEYSQEVRFGGHIEYYTDEHGQRRTHWVDTHNVLAIPYDMPIVGYQNDTVNTLRLWKATATDVFDLEEFNAGSYTEAVREKNNAEHISMVLYPNDSSENGKELRLRQQYFLASASLQDAIRIWEMTAKMEGVSPDYSCFAADNVFQMNDTHPTIAVAELMRILLDDKLLSWDEAWAITGKCLAYTNHTLLPEALERWPVDLFERLLPRLLEIIYEINARFLKEVAQRWPGDTDRQQRMSIIEEGDYRQVRMAWLAIVGSFSVNGVAALHSQLLVEGLFHDFYELWPHKFNNKTNGVTPRRWVAHANPAMSTLISSVIGEQWVRDLAELEKLKPYAAADQAAFQAEWQGVKQANKQRLAGLIKKECGVVVNTQAMFDVQVKRIHEYKRQLLNVLHVIHLYSAIKQGSAEHVADRVVIIGGKAAPGYYMAKSIIKLINNVAEVVNNDPEIGDRLKLVFFPNYRVSSMEVIAAAADLSEQISTAGKEASGTGNMKFMMNGALTVGTYDGANIEILEAVGEDNFFLFGLKAEEVAELHGHYQPEKYVENDSDLQQVVQLLSSGHFNACEPGIFDDILNAMFNPDDPWMTFADFRAYVEAQEQVSQLWQDQQSWTRKSILNTASSGFFSTDRTMAEYNRDIWKLV